MKQGSLFKSKLVSRHEWRACTHHQAMPISHIMTLVHRPCTDVQSTIVLSHLENPGLKDSFIFT